MPVPSLTLSSLLHRTVAPSLGLSLALVATSVVTVGPLPGSAAAAQTHPVKSSRVQVTATPTAVDRLGVYA